MAANLSGDFQFWSYRVSHGELLIRSPKNEVVARVRNVDVMFSGVEYVDLPRHLGSIAIGQPTHVDVARASQRMGKMVKREEIFAIDSNGQRYLVVAAQMQIQESDMDIFDSPFS